MVEEDPLQFIRDMGREEPKEKPKESPQVVGSHERLKQIVNKTRKELTGRGMYGKADQYLNKYEGDRHVRLGSSYVPISKREIPASISKEIGEAVTKLFRDNEMRLDSVSTSPIHGTVMGILREHWSRIEYAEAKKENLRVSELVFGIKKEAFEYVVRICDECLLGMHDNPIKELRELRELKWLENLLSQKKTK